MIDETGKVQYHRFTTWERLKRWVRNIDAAIWYGKHYKEDK